MFRAAKPYITFVLSILLIANVLHADRAHQADDRYGMCDVNCCDENHRSKNHLIKDCTNENNRWFIESADDYSVEVYQTMLYSAYELYHNSSPSYELYSRPPPVR